MRHLFEVFSEVTNMQGSRFPLQLVVQSCSQIQIPAAIAATAALML